MATKKVGDWSKAGKLMRLMSRGTATAIKKAAADEAEYFRKKVVQAFDTSGKSNGITWKANKATTLTSKSGTKPLIDSGDLKRAIEVHKKGGDYFVGIRSGKQHRDGRPLDQIATTHEFGKILAVRITAKMLRFLHANADRIGLGKGSGGQLAVGKTLMIEIPKRSFLQSTADAHFKPAVSLARMESRIAHHLGGVWRLLYKAPSSLEK